MKMTKIAFWRKVKENCEKNEIVPCIGIYDSDCPYGTGSKECKMCEGGNGKEALAYAEAYIKRHEQKSKKRIIPTKYTPDIQPDKTNAECKRVVTLPKEKPEIKSTIQCYKCVSVQTCKRKEKELSILPACDGYISNESMNYIHTVDPNEKKVESVLTTTPDMSKPTPLEIAKMIRDNGYSCNDIPKRGICFNKRCPLSGKNGCGYSHNDMKAEQKHKDLRKQLIDNYISSHEKIEPVCEHLVGDLCGNAFETCDKECLANSEILKPEPVIEPIKFQLPKIAFVVFADGIGVRGKNFTIDSDGNLTHSGCLCYDNIDKAVAVWNATYGKEVKK